MYAIRSYYEPSKKASKQAVDLKHICLSSLAEELELALLDSELEQLMKDRSLKERNNFV